MGLLTLPDHCDDIPIDDPHLELRQGPTAVERLDTRQCPVSSPTIAKGVVLLKGLRGLGSCNTDPAPHRYSAQESDVGIKTDNTATSPHIQGKSWLASSDADG